MSYFAHFPFVRSVFPFALGIVFAIYAHYNSPVWLVFALFFCIAFIFETFIFKLSSGYSWRHFSGVLFFFAFFFMGTFLVYVNSLDFSPNHFSRLQKPDYLCIRVAEPPVEKEKSYKLIAIVTHTHANKKTHSTSGKLLCYVSKKAPYKPKPGDELIIKANILPIDGAKNPGQFDYKQYLYYHNIFHQCFLQPYQFKYVHRSGNWLKNAAYDVRESLIRTFRKNGLSGNELAVASALLFGETDQLEPALVRAYAATGALHVLSVSGLHVAIIYGFLKLVLSFLQTHKNGHLVIGSVTLLLIWFYAFLTGLCPSVLRSATMFTFIVFGEMFSRKSTIYNSIAASAFVLLAHNPFLIMEVGFQLSYLAVTGIIIIYPIVYNQLVVKNKILNWIWNISAVSIAAQLATFPLGILYFHQFPNYFLFSNLLVIPLASIILYVGITASLFYAWEFIHAFFISILHTLLWFLNTVVRFIEELPFALIEGLSIGIFETSLLYSLLALWLIWYHTSNPHHVKFILALIVCICCLQLNEMQTISTQKLLIVYHIPNGTAIDIVQGRQHVFIADSSFYNNADQLLFHVKHNWDNLNLNKPFVHFLHQARPFFNPLASMQQKVIHFKNYTMGILDNSYNYKTDSFPNVDFILLCKNVNINLNKARWLKSNIKILADASNKLSKIHFWEKQAQQRNLKFHNIGTKGAYIFNLQ